MNFDLDITTPEELEAIETCWRAGVALMSAAEILDESLVATMSTTLRLARRHLAAEMKAEMAQKRVNDALAFVRSSEYFPFWEALTADQPVRWNQHPNAEYTVVDGTRAMLPPNMRYRGSAIVPATADQGMWIELRRASGKTFWCHVAQVRPLDWVPIHSSDADDPDQRRRTSDV
jgi:hypothetical protein